MSEPARLDYWEALRAMLPPTQLNLLSEIPPVFACQVDESAGLKEQTQLGELPGDTFEDIFE